MEQRSTNLLSVSLCILVLLSMAKSTFGSGESVLLGGNWTKGLGLCRLDTTAYVPQEQFNRESCARCYLYMVTKAFLPGKRLEICRHGRLCPPKTNCSLEESSCYTHKDMAALEKKDENNSSFIVYDSFVNGMFAAKWESCCADAERCCREQLKSSKANKDRIVREDDELYCPATWDGWSCFEDTPAGQTTEKPCPLQAYQFTEKPACTRYSRKKCQPDGQWYRAHQKEFTHYDCNTVDNRHVDIYLSIYLHLTSTILLLPTLVIFSMYKQLRVIRILLHKNVCITLLLHGLTVIAKDYFFTLPRVTGKPVTSSLEYLWLCRTIMLFNKYLRLSQYAWMFCEGFYLHKILVTAFKEQKSMLPFYAFGWVMPAFFAAIYGTLIITSSDTDTSCELTGVQDWIMNTPALVCLICNFFFLTNIMRVLVSKLRSSHGQEPIQFRKAARAVMILFPLFGMHFLLGIYRTPELCGVWVFYQYLTRASDGLQGSFVALLFCYLNGEVHHLLKRSYGRYALRRGINGGRSSRFAARMSFSTHVSSVAESHVTRCCDVTKPLTQSPKIHDTNC